MKSPIEIMLDKVDFTPTEPSNVIEGLPYVTHQGVLKIGDELEILVCQLNTGERIIPEIELDRVFGQGWKEMVLKT